jgi:large subunit ribosomal protein L9
MKVILLQDIRGVGKKHDVKDVSDGYAAHFLFPKGLAEVASAGKVGALAEEKKVHAEHEELVRKRIRTDLAKLQGGTITLSAKGNQKGNLFEAIKETAVKAAIKKEFNIELPDGIIKLSQPIKTTGAHTIEILFEGHSTIFTLDVRAGK